MRNFFNGLFLLLLAVIILFIIIPITKFCPSQANMLILLIMTTIALIFCAMTWYQVIQEENFGKFCERVRWLREKNLKRSEIPFIIKYAKKNHDCYKRYLMDEDSKSKDYNVKSFLDFFGAVEPIRKIVEDKRLTTGKTVLEFNSFQQELQYPNYQKEYEQILSDDQIKFLNGQNFLEN